MAISVVQTVFGEATTSANSVSCTLTVSPGNCLHVFGQGANISSGACQLSCSDTNGGYYKPIATMLENQRAAVHWVLTNTLGGSVTITVNFATSVINCGIAVKEISGTSGYQGIHAESTPSNTGTATDAITTGNFTPTAQPALVSSFCVDTGTPFNTTGVPVTGTNYTTDGNGWQWGKGINALCAESQRITSTSALAATYTAAATTSGNDRYKVCAAVFTEGVLTGGVAASWVLR